MVCRCAMHVLVRTCCTCIYRVCALCNAQMVVVSSAPQSPPLNRSKQTVVCALTRWCLFSNHQYGMSAICKVVHCMYNCTLYTYTAPSPSNVSKQTVGGLVESGSDLLLTAVSTVQVLRRQIGFSLSTNPQPIPTTPHTSSKNVLALSFGSFT